MAITKEERIKQAWAEAKEKLIKKYGETFLKIPQLRKAGATLEEIGRMLGVSRERVRVFLKYHFPESLHPDRPENLYSTTQLLKLSGRRDAGSTKELLRRHGIKPVGRYAKELLWGEDAKQFLQALLNRLCRRCGEPLLVINLLYKYCEKCRKRKK